MLINCHENSFFSIFAVMSLGRHGASIHWQLNYFVSHLILANNKGNMKKSTPMTGGFPSQRAIYAESVSILWQYDASEAYGTGSSSVQVMAWRRPGDKPLKLKFKIFFIASYYINSYKIWTYDTYNQDIFSGALKWMADLITLYSWPRTSP